MKDLAPAVVDFRVVQGWNMIQGICVILERGRGTQPQPFARHQSVAGFKHVSAVVSSCSTSAHTHQHRRSVTCVPTKPHQTLLIQRSSSAAAELGRSASL